MTPILALDHVSVKFGSESILNELNLEIQQGERVVIVGPSGCGKSTLLKTLAGLISPTRGKFLFENRDFHALKESQQQAILVRMGMLFQKNALFDSMTIDENVRFPLREVTTKSSNEIDLIVDRFLSAVGLAQARDLFPDEISGGMQKRLGIARALALDPEIVLYDDPTAGLDPITSKKIIELILELQKGRGSTVVAVSNDMNRAYQLADRILFLFDGEILDTGSPDSTRRFDDGRVQQFIHGKPSGPLMGLR